MNHDDSPLDLSILDQINYRIQGIGQVLGTKNLGYLGSSRIYSLTAVTLLDPELVENLGFHHVSPLSSNGKEHFLLIHGLSTSSAEMGLECLH